MLRHLFVGIGLVAAMAAGLAPAVPTSRAVLVVGAGPVRKGDTLLRERLERRGYAVTLADERLVAADAVPLAGAVVVVSSSAADESLGAALKEMPAPVVLLQPQFFDDLGLAGTAPGLDFGFETTRGRTGVTVGLSGHALAAGLEGDLRIATRPIDAGWARPAADALVVATLSGAPDRPVAFAYERGAAMVGVDAPARRAAVFGTEPSLPYLTGEGWRLVDAAIDWAAGREAAPPPAPGPAGPEESAAPKATTPPARKAAPASTPQTLGPRSALFVVGNATLNVGDTAVRNRLQNQLNFTTILTKTGSAAATADATGKSLVVISSTVTPTDVNIKFRDVSVPVLLWENQLLDDMQMTPAGSGNMSTTGSQSQVVIATPAHELGAGLTGTVGVLTSGSDTFGWGVPAATAVKGASIVGNSSRLVSFGYASGVVMSGGTAHERRVALFMNDNTANTFSTNGWKLFDAAVNWAAPPTNSAPTVSAGPDRTITMPAAASLDGTVTDDSWPPPPATLTTTWSKISGPGTVTFGNASAVDTTATVSQAGTYVLRLTANDGAASTSDDMVVTANAPTNTAPLVNAGPDQTVSLPSSASLVGSASDDGLPAPPSFVTTWSKTSGPGTVAFGNVNAVATSATFSATGTYVLRLTATDGALTSFDELTVTANRSALFVAGSTTLTSADNAVKTRLESLGFVVTVRTASVSASEAIGKSVIAISATVSSSLGAKFRDTPVPVVIWKSSLYDDMGMTGTISNTDFGTTSRTEVVVVNDEHPLAGGTAGTVTVRSTASNLSWGNPGPAAAVAVREFADGPRAMVFGYESGATMVGFTAAARRVGLFLGDVTADPLTAEGWAIVDGAILWAAGLPMVQVAPPTLSLPGGTYPAGQSVTVTAGAVGSTLRYTQTGIAPTAGDPVVASGAAVPLGNFTLTARAWKLGFLPSTPVSAAYAITGDVTARDVAAGSYHSLALRQDGTVWAWGLNNAGQTGGGAGASVPVPRLVNGLSGVTGVAAGAFYSLALRQGVVWSWGDNQSGQLGDPSVVFQRSTPGPVSGLTGVTAIAAGGGHVLALKGDGSVWAWGRNVNGELGTGGTSPSGVPVPVSGLTGVTIVAVAAGSSHSMALSSTGQLYTWGLNENGQLGQGSVTAPVLVPTAVATLPDAAGIAAGLAHSLAVKADGTVWAWGNNLSGQVGPSLPSWVTAPTLVAVANPPHALGTAGGSSHSIALRDDGRLWSWGRPDLGALGRWGGSEPGQVEEITDGLKVASGDSHNVVVSSDGSVWTWGDNTVFQIGDGTTDRRSWPVKIAEAGMNWKVATPAFTPPGTISDTELTVTLTSVTPGATIHYSLNGEPTTDDPSLPSGGTLSVTSTGAYYAKAWKDGWAPSGTGVAFYQLQVKPLTASPGPGVNTAPVTVTLSCATPGASIFYTTDGTPPTEESTPYTGPLTVAHTTQLWAVASRGGWVPAYVNATYTMNFGTLNAPVISPAPATYSNSVSVTMTADPGAIIRYTTDGTEPLPYGDIYSGPLTIGRTTTLKAKAFHPDYTASATTEASYTIELAAPVFTPGGGSYPMGQAVVVSEPTDGAVIHYTLNGDDPGEGHPVIASGAALSLTAPTTLRARAFKLGTTPSPITSATYTVTGQAVTGMVAAGYDHALAATSAGGAWAWGWNTTGQLGDGTQTPRVLPTAVPGLTNVVAVAGGDMHSVALTSAGAVWAWGENGSGQVGDGTTTRRLLPVPVVGLTGVVAIAAGEDFNLALKGDGTVWAWGTNLSGQLGTDSTTGSLVPVQAVGLSGVSRIAAGARHSLALKTDGTVWAWGQNDVGQLGLGSTTNQLHAVLVDGLSGVTQVATGRSFSMALGSDHRVWAWGDNAVGQLGDTAGERHSPAIVPGIDAVTAIAAGAGHALAIRNDGTLWSWGSNERKQLGHAVTNSPAIVTGVAGAVQAAGGGGCTVVRTFDGRVFAFGAMAAIGVGDGTSAVRSVPVALSDPGYDWLAGTPIVTPDPGTYSPTDQMTLTLTTASTGAVIHYTVDGTTPTASSAAVSSGGQVVIDRSRTLRARTWDADGPPSNELTAPFALQVAMPVLTPPGDIQPLGTSIQVTVATTGATIHYAIDAFGVDEDDPVIASGGTLPPLSDTLSILVGAWKSGWEPSEVTGGFYLPQPLPPTITPASGVYSSPLQVTLGTPVLGAQIHYTTSGRVPTLEDPWLESGQSFTLTNPATVKAVVMRPGWAPGAVGVASYLLNMGTVGGPTLAPPPGSYTAEQAVTIASATQGATLRYTLDGTDPTSASPLYDAPLLVDTSLTLRARAFKGDWTPSAAAGGAYVISLARVATPTFSVPGGRYTTQRSVAVACSTSGAEIHYTTSGLEPQTTDPVLPANGIVVVDRPTRLKARAFKAGLDPSSARTVDYWITGALAGGLTHSVALDASGHVWSWGGNDAGQLGNGTNQPHTPPAVVSGVPPARAIAAGSKHSLALADDGTVWAWGANASGQLGRGTTAAGWTPAPVPGLAGAVAIAAGADHSVAVKADGTVWVWGANATYQLGRTDTTPALSPVQIADFGGAILASAGSGFTAVLKTDGARTGTVWSWGRNDWGQLGLSMKGSPSFFASRSIDGVTQLASGDHQTVALTDAGLAWAWGDGSQFQLGLGLTQNMPGWDGPGPGEVKVTNAVQIAAGGRHGLAITRGALMPSALWGWGARDNGQLGDGLISVPRMAPGPTLFKDGLAVAAGDAHSLGVRLDGTVWAWGLDQFGQLGVPPPPEWNVAVPAQVPGLTLFAPGIFSADPDGDGLSTWDEWALGSDPLNPDTNGDGISDGLAARRGISLTDMDMDDDGRINADELRSGTDPFVADTDGDGVNDGTDAFPLDPTRWDPPPTDPGDTTPPVITLVEPPTATPH